MMQPVALSFGVLIKTRATLTALGERVGRVLGCRLEPFRDATFSYGEAVGASCLGLDITLSHDPEVSEGEERTYVLSGYTTEAVLAQWEIGVPVHRISDYVLGLMRTVDAPDWYIPAFDEDDANGGLIAPDA